MSQIAVDQASYESLCEEITLLRQRTELLQQRLDESQKSNRFLTSIVENLPLAVFVKDVDNDFRYMLWNQAAETVYGMPREQAIGYNSYDWVDRELADQFLAEDLAILQQGNKATFIEDFFVSQDGRELQQRIIKIGLFDEAQKPTHILCIAEDITDRKQAEEALRQSEAQLKQQTEQLQKTLAQLHQTQSQLIQNEKMSSLGQLVAGVAHEINNPVNFIHGNLAPAQGYIQDLLALIELYQACYPQSDPKVQALMEEIDLEFIQEDLPRLLSSMRLGTERICEIVKSLRNFSRLDESDKKAVNLHDGLESTLVILGHRLKARSNHPEIQIDRHYGELPLVECYAGQLNQVFLNILSNALDAIEEQRHQQALSGYSLVPGQITLRTEQLNTEWVRIQLIDNGPGMSEAVQKQLFDPFFTTKPVGRGTGMGMAISYQIVTEKHGGSISCSSQLGKGSTFTIDIPIES